MARIRTIKPEFPQSESMGRVSREARLCFILLWTILDDDGRARGSSRMLASLLYPYDDDAPKGIERWLRELEVEGCIVRYKIGEDSYIASTNWLKHQRIDKPSVSRLPPPPEVVANPREPSRTLATDLVPSTLDLVSGPRTKKGSAEPQAASAPPPPSPPFISIPTNRNGQEVIISEADVNDYERTFPIVDVRQELREMRRWSLDNPAKRKTAGGVKTFVNRWLSKEQDKGKSNGIAGSNRRNGASVAHQNHLAGLALAADEAERAGVLSRTGNGREPAPEPLELGLDGEAHGSAH